MVILVMMVPLEIQGRLALLVILDQLVIKALKVTKVKQDPKVLMEVGGKSEMLGTREIPAQKELQDQLEAKVLQESQVTLVQEA